MSKFVPSDVPLERVALLGAATDWLDGLNKELDAWSVRSFSHSCYIVDGVVGIPSTTWVNSVVYASERRCMSSSGHSAITSSKSLDLTRLKVFSFISKSLASQGMDRYSQCHRFLCQITGPPAGEVARTFHRGTPSAFDLRTRSCR